MWCNELDARRRGTRARARAAGRIAAAIERLEVRRLLAVDSLDTSFDGDGARVLAFTDLPGMSQTSAYLDSVAVGGGRIFASGSLDDGITNGVRRAAVAAFLSDGTPDPSFGDGGRVIYTPNTAYMPEYFAVTTDANGNVLAAGQSDFFAASGDMLISRYTAAGAPDTTFGSAGNVMINDGAISDHAYALGLQTDNKIVVAGDLSRTFAVARLTSTGALDTSFGAGGHVKTSFGGTRGAANDVAVLSDGKIIAAGYANINNVLRPVLARYTTSGALDFTFIGTGLGAGMADLTPVTGNAVITALAVQSDGKIVVAGKTNTTAAQGTMFIARFDSSGRVDTSFSGDGVAYVGDVGASLGADVQLEADGTILYTYSDYGSSSTENTVVVGRLTPYGAPDLRFGTNGVFDIVNPPEATTLTQVRSLGMQPDGKAVIGAYTLTGSHYSMYLMRLDAASAGAATLDAGGTIQITGTASDDSVEVRNDFTGHINVTINNQLAGSFAFSSVNAINADLGEGDDLLTLRQATFAPLTYNGNTGRDAFIDEASNGSDDDLIIDATHITGGGNDATIAGVEDVTVDAMASNDTITVDVGTAYAGTLLVAGNTQDDVFNVLSAPNGPPTVTLAGGDGDDVFNLGDVTCWVDAEGGAGNDTLRITGGDTDSLGLVLDYVAGVGNAAANYSGIELLDLDAGGGQDTMTLYGLPAGTQLDLNMGAGTDFVRLGAGTSATSFNNDQISVIGGDGNDELQPTSTLSTPETYTLTANRFSWPDRQLNLDFDDSLEFVRMVSGGGNDTLNIDYSAGLPGIARGLFFNGLNGTDTLNFIGSAAAESIAFNTGAITFAGASMSYSNTEAFTFNGNHGLDDVSVNAGAVTLIGSQTLANLGISNAAVTAVSPGADKWIETNALTIGGTGKLNLLFSDLILHSSESERFNDLSRMTGLIKQGFNLGGTLWAGNGITTTAGGNGSSSYAALGVILNDLAAAGGGAGPIYTTFDGESVGANDVLVRKSYFGDADADGSVSTNDYFQIDNGFLGSKTGWINGDFDYDGAVTTNDYFLIDNAFLSQTGPHAPALALAAPGADSLPLHGAIPLAMPDDHKDLWDDLIES
jgi:uncharacterized delta-60 repeat protein